jgi:outer membrane protein OmpA-like peptidoglycan-associated protein
MRSLVLTALLMSLAAPALAQDDEPGSKDHAMVPRIPQYIIHSYEATDFDKAEFPMPDDKEQSVEGRHWEVTYHIKDNVRHQSPLAIIRNYQNAVRAKGGTMLYQDDNQTTLRLTTPTGELWLHIDVSNDGEMYTANIIEKAAMAQQVELSAGELARALNETGSVAMHNILFDTGKATLTAGSAAALAVVGDVLKNDQALRLEIQGHTDNVGVKAANLTLSQARAAAVRDYLIKTFGIMPERLTSAGYGDTKPVTDNATDDGRAKNRRVELVKMAAKAAPGAAGSAEGPGQWTGRVTTGMMAVGGETTGILLTTTASDRLELEAAPALRQQLQQLNGKTVTVRGTLETRVGVERTRRVIRVAAIEVN